MARAKKDGRHVNLYIEKEVIDRLEMYCKDAGQTKTIAIERALTMFMDDYYKRMKKLTK